MGEKVIVDGKAYLGRARPHFSTRNLLFSYQRFSFCAYRGRLFLRTSLLKANNLLDFQSLKSFLVVRMKILDLPETRLS